MLTFQGGSMDEWTGFVREHFDDGSRVQLTLLSRSKIDLRLFGMLRAARQNMGWEVWNNR